MIVESGQNIRRIDATSPENAAKEFVRQILDSPRRNLGYLVAVTDRGEKTYFDSLGIAADLGYQVEAREEVV